MNIKEEIRRMCREKNAVIMAHYYTDGEIQDMADFVGDSLALAQKAATTDADIIVMCGVHFMGETSKILCPDKKVIVPDLEATWSLAESCPADKFADFVKQYPGHKVISYVNTTAATKAHTDVVVTSTNARQIVESFPTDEGTYYAYLQAYAQSHWTIHYAGQLREVTFTQADTLLWESQLHYNRTQSLSDLPSRQEALLYLARELGNRMGSSFAPSWQTTRRYIYELPDLQAGLDAFRLQRWNSAINQWLTIVDSKDKKAAACAAANIAIAYEMLGDYASACDYAQRASRLFGAWKTAYGRQQQVNIRYYLAQLQARQARERDL